MSKTLSKGLYILTLFNEEDAFLTVEELSKRANIPKPTVYRLLKPLEEYRFIKKVEFVKGSSRIESDHYQLGVKCLELGAIAASQLELRNISYPYMKQLRDELGESVQLVIRDGNEAVYIEKVESDKPVRLYTKIGRRAPLYAGACPRAILSFMPDDEIRRILKPPLFSIGPNTNIKIEEIWESIIEAREKGYTFSESELEAGSAAFATPLFDHFGDIAGALSIAGFSDHYMSTDDRDFVIPMWKVAEKISKGLGFKKAYPFK